MNLKNEGKLALSVIRNLLLISGVERNPGPKCKVISNSDTEKCSHQDTHEVQNLRKRVHELEAEVLAVNVLRVTELANQKHEYEQRLCQNRGCGTWYEEWMYTAGRLREFLPKDKLRLFVYFVLVAIIIFILLKLGHKHHGRGHHHLFWGMRH